MKSLRSAALAVAAFGALTAAGLSASPAVVKIDGSSTVFPITEGVAEDFQKAKKGAVKVTVGISGTGGGFKKFCRGETDISNASRPILKKEMEDCKKAGIEYYRAAGRVRRAHRRGQPEEHLPQADHRRRAEEDVGAGGAGQGHALEPGQPGLARRADQAVRRRVPIRARSTTSPKRSSARPRPAAATTPPARTTTCWCRASPRDVNALGYFGYAYYAENQDKLKAVPIVEKAGKPAVAPSEGTVLDGSYQPLARPIFIYVNAKSLAKPEVKEFVEFYMKNGAKLAKEVKYVPLPAKAYTINLEHLAKGKKGTVFGGEAEVGVTIDELLKREAKL